MMQDCGEAEPVEGFTGVKHQASLQQTYTVHKNLTFTQNTNEAFEKSAMGWIFCCFSGGVGGLINK